MNRSDRNSVNVLRCSQRMGRPPSDGLFLTLPIRCLDLPALLSLDLDLEERAFPRARGATGADLRVHSERLEEAEHRLGCVR